MSFGADRKELIGVSIHIRRFRGVKQKPRTRLNRVTAKQGLTYQLLKHYAKFNLVRFADHPFLKASIAISFRL